jgi:hypothetical protein
LAGLHGEGNGQPSLALHDGRLSWSVVGVTAAGDWRSRQHQYANQSRKLAQHVFTSPESFG